MTSPICLRSCHGVHGTNIASDGTRTSGQESTCPSDRSSLDEDSLTRLRVVEALILKLEVRCSNRSKGDTEEGCEWMGKLAERETHMRSECAFQPARCQHPDCSFASPRATLAAHEASCEFRLVDCEHCQQPVRFLDMTNHVADCLTLETCCPNSCGASLQRKDLAEHRSLCPNESVACPFQVHGCSATVQRKDFASHQAEAAWEHSEMASRRVEAAAEAARQYRFHNDSLCESLEQVNLTQSGLEKKLEAALKASRVDRRLPFPVLRSLQHAQTLFSSSMCSACILHFRSSFLSCAVIPSPTPETITLFFFL